MTIILPNQVWKQNNYSDRFGSIWSSFNLDLTSMMGKLRISPRFIINSTATDDSDLGIPCAVKAFTTTGPRLLFLLTGGYLFYSTGGPEDAWTKYSGAPHPGGALDADYSDMEVFPDLQELYFFGTGTAIQYMAADGTTTALTGRLATGAGLHDSIYFRAQNKIYIIDNSSKGVTSINTSRAAVLATSGSQYSINNLADGSNTVLSWINATSTHLWIGTINFSGNGVVYKWDGSQNSGPNSVYQLTTAGSFSCVIKDDTPWVLDTEGRLLQFNGATFVEKDKFPVDLSKGKYMPHVYKGTQRLTHYNGMALIDNKINILANTVPYDTSWPATPSLERMNSGIWEYTEETGLYHKASLGTTKSGSTITDYGQSKLKYVGCLGYAKTPNLGVTAGSINGTLVAGGEYYTDASSSLRAVWYDDFANTLQKSGILTTPKLFSREARELWKDAIVRLRQQVTSGDKLIVKYRTTEVEPVEATITFTSTTQFTVPTSSFTTAPVVGDEVEILQGAIGAGKTAHITVIATNGANYEVTVDETMTSATTQTGKARFQGWKKIMSFTSQVDDVAKFPIGKSASWIQLRIYWICTGKNEIHDVILESKGNQMVE